MNTKLSNAINVLLDELDKDKSEGSYFYSWQANISMAFFDEFMQRHEGTLTHRQLSEVANASAKRFLNLLIIKPSAQPADIEGKPDRKISKWVGKAEQRLEIRKLAKKMFDKYAIYKDNPIAWSLWKIAFSVALNPQFEMPKSELKPIVMYGIAGIYQPVDSSKIYYHKAIELRKRGVSDSCNKYFIILKNYNGKSNYRR